MFFVYVLKSLRDGKRYVGLTRNLEQRVKQHNRGQEFSTKGRRPFVLVYHEEFGTLEEARRREIYFKTAAGRRFLDKHEDPANIGPVAQLDRATAF
jgi:putative endonuclease